MLLEMTLSGFTQALLELVTSPVVTKKGWYFGSQTNHMLELYSMNNIHGEIYHLQLSFSGPTVDL